MKNVLKKLAFITPLLFLFFAASAQFDSTIVCYASFFATPNDSDPLTFEFIDYSGAYFFNEEVNIDSWAWQFGDGTGSDQQNPTHTYASSGTYSVSLTIAAGDCTSTYEMDILAFDCECTQEWDPVCVDNPGGETVTFPSACVAECLGYTDYYDCGDSTDLCYAAFYVTFEENNPLTVNFIDASYGEITNWNWDFDDGSSSTEQNPIHTFAETGVYAVTLAISGDDCSDEITYDITVTDCVCPDIYDPVCVETPNGTQISFDNSCIAECNGFYEFVECDTDSTETFCYGYFYYEMTDNDYLTLNFTDESWTSSDIISWSWSFGDGTGSTEQNPSHTYGAEGTYTVSLTITTPDCENTYEETVWAGNGGDWYPEPCYALFWFDQAEDDPMTLNFTDFSYGEPTSWEWNFGDGSTSDEQFPTHTFAADGYYQVTLSIESEDCTNSYSMLVWVNQNIEYPDPNEDCIAIFIPFINSFPVFQDTTVNNYTVFFFNLSSAGSELTYTWDFGDGTTSTDYFPVHTYPAEGTYDVTLTITADDCSSTFTTTLYLSDGEGFQGNSTSMALILSTNELETVEKAIITPNPVNDKMTLQFTSKEAMEYNLIITSSTGKEYINSQYKANTGDNAITIQLNGIPSGLYFAQIRMENKIKTLKFIVK